MYLSGKRDAVSLSQNDALHIHCHFFARDLLSPLVLSLLDFCSSLSECASPGLLTLSSPILPPCSPMLGSFMLCSAFASSLSPLVPNTVALQIQSPQRFFNLDDLGTDDTASLMALEGTVIRAVDLELVRMALEGRSINSFD